MSENTAIEWADHTFNPWTGCTKVSPGCDHCYAEAWAKRSGIVQWGPDATRRRTTPANWREPLKWDRLSEQWVSNGGPRTRVFCASLADVFDNEVDPAWRRDLFALIARTPHLDWLLLTKRIGNALPMLDHAFFRMASNGWKVPTWPWPNVWLGATVVNQAEAYRDIPKLLATPAVARFLSIEPMLGPIDLERDTGGTLWIGGQRGCGGTHSHSGDPGGHDEGSGTSWVVGDPRLPHHHHDNRCRRGIDWVIAGGESGPKARPAHPDWFRSLRDQCDAAHVPFLFKQWGEWCPRGPESLGYPSVDGVPRVRLTNRGENGQRLGAKGGDDVWMNRAGKKAAGRLLDGVEHNGFPSPPHDHERTSQ